MTEFDMKLCRWEKVMAAVIVALVLCASVCASVIVIGWATKANADNFKKVEELPGPHALQGEACKSVGGTLIGYECVLDDGTVVNIEQRQRAIDSGEVEPPK